ncbi:hypothetical protein R1sor_006693 [Riccia sorocarpa]|uniref:Uncharacterized protein n=1 Tax=Riccia sorocarpa TaxID=122646 RepID=A0ABD3HRS2_9MARC
MSEKEDETKNSEVREGQRAQRCSSLVVKEERGSVWVEFPIPHLLLPLIHSHFLAALPATLLDRVLGKRSAAALSTGAILRAGSQGRVCRRAGLSGMVKLTLIPKANKHDP